MLKLPNNELVNPNQLIKISGITDCVSGIEYFLTDESSVVENGALLPDFEHSDFLNFRLYSKP